MMISSYKHNAHATLTCGQLHNNIIHLCPNYNLYVLFFDHCSIHSFSSVLSENSVISLGYDVMVERCITR